MTINQQKLELANENKRGVSFLMAASMYWFGIAVMSHFMTATQTFFVSLWGTGFIFPASIVIAKMIDAKIFYKNEISSLGVWANVFQVFFIPVFIISAKANIYFPPIFMGVLAGAHFVFYYWLFNSKAYLIIAFSMVIVDYSLGYYYLDQSYTVIGYANALLLLITCMLLTFENKNGIKATLQTQVA
jgi:hypothetical protein